MTQESNPGSSALQADSLPTELPGKPHFETITKMCEALWGGYRVVSDDLGYMMGSALQTLGGPSLAEKLSTTRESQGGRGDSRSNQTCKEPAIGGSTWVMVKQKQNCYTN